MSCMRCNQRIQLKFSNVGQSPVSKMIIGNFGDKYCSRCGKYLLERCFSCNGSGKITKSDGYCPECGDKLERTEDCTSCGGSGETKRSCCVWSF